MKRNYGIDLLRMVLMFMVVVLHVLGHGGVLDEAKPLSVNYSLAWLLECAAYCAVNCYALITGYVYYKGKYRFSSLIQIWIQTWIYSVGIAGAMWILKPEYFSIPRLLHACFPVISQGYWYVSAYVGLFVLIPVLNIAIDHMDERRTKFTLLLSCLVFSVMPVFSGRDPFGSGAGYSTFWLAFMYVIGASIRKYDWGKTAEKKRLVLLYLCSVCVAWMCKLGVDKLNTFLPEDTPVRINLISYTAPTIIAAAIGLFLLFQRMHLSTAVSKIVAKYSPAAFGVYLIHEQVNFSSYFVYDNFRFLAEQNPVVLIAGVIGFALIIYTVCLLADYFRLGLFKKLKIQEKATFADTIANRLCAAKETHQ